MNFFFVSFFCVCFFFVLFVLFVVLLFFLFGSFCLFVLFVRLLTCFLKPLDVVDHIFRNFTSLPDMRNFSLICKHTSDCLNLSLRGSVASIIARQLFAVHHVQHGVRSEFTMVFKQNALKQLAHPLQLCLAINLLDEGEGGKCSKFCLKRE